MLQIAVVAALALVCAAILVELRRLRRLVERLSRTRISVASIAEISQFEDAANQAWEEFLKAEALRPGEELFPPEKQAALAVERYRAKHKHDTLLLHLNRARQAEIDVRAGRKTLTQVSAEFQTSIKELIAPQVEEKRVYQEALEAAETRAHATPAQRAV